jgi:hypothetical protein
MDTKKNNYMCWVRDEVPNSKTGDVVMYYFVRAVAHLRGQ